MRKASGNGAQGQEHLHAFVAAGVPIFSTTRHSHAAFELNQPHQFRLVCPGIWELPADVYSAMQHPRIAGVPPVVSL
jgi:hypothetical protein